MIKKNLILLLGNYNAFNIGDDLLLQASYSELQKQFEDFEVKIIAPRRPYDAPLVPTGFRSLFTTNWFKTLYLFTRAKYAVFGGGGLLNPEEPKSVFIWGVQIFILNLFKVKIILLANSFSSTNKIINFLLKKVSFITVRDSISLNLISKLNLPIIVKKSTDLVFILNKNDLNFDFKFDNQFILLNLREYSSLLFSNKQKFFNNIAEFILNNTNYDLYLLPFSKDDLGILRKISVKYQQHGRVVILPFDYKLALASIQQCEFLISERLHPLLSAIIFKKKIFALSYSSKVFSLLLDIGVANEAIVKSNKEDISSLNYEYIENNLYDGATVDYQKLSTLAHSNFDLLKLYLME